MIRNYIITALRNIWRNKIFSSINIFGLSLGIASCMLIFLYVSDELSFDRFHKKLDHVYHLTIDIIDKDGNISHSPCTGMMPGPSFKKDIPEIEEFVRIQYASCDIKKDKEFLSQEGLWVDENFFSVFTFKALYGNTASALKDLHSVVISEDVAIRYFGKTNVVGNTLLINTGGTAEPFMVTAVLERPPVNSSIRPDMLLPIKYSQLQYDDKEWMNSFLNTFVVLRPGTSPETVALKCNAVFQSEAGSQIKEMKERYQIEDKFVYGLQPLAKMHLNKDYPAFNGLHHASQPLYSKILGGIAAFILLIACINFINLTVARSLKRAREIGVRKAIGSERRQLIFQFLGESFVLSSLSFLLAIVLVLLVLPFFNTVSGKSLAFSYLLNAKLILGYVVLLLLTAFGAGFYPALVLSRFNPVEALYGKLRFSGNSFLSKGLVVLQFSLATFFIIGTVAVYTQFNYLVNYDLGFDKMNVLKVTTGKMNARKLQTIKNALLQDPSIQMASGRQGGEYFTMAQINGTSNIEFEFSRIDEENFPLFKIPVVQGRNFSNAFPADSALSVMVTETFVKQAGWKNPIGEVIDFNYKNKKYQVVGVVKDFYARSLTSTMKPSVFAMDPELPYSVIYLRIDPAKQAAALRHTEKVIKEFFPAMPYQYEFLDDLLYENYGEEEKWRQIVFFSAMLTIFISCIGLFGLATLASEKRAKEIGVRKVLGASTSLIARILATDFLKLILIAGCVAIPAAWIAVNAWLENYPYRIGLSVYLFLAPLIAVILLALLTVSYQTIRAARANPVKNLRTE